MADKTIIQEIADRIVRTVNPLRVILFGSAAREDGGKDSDLDFLVVMPNGTHRRQISQEIYRALYGLGIAKDIVVATEDDLAAHSEDPGYVYKQAVSEGMELYHAR